MESKEPITAEAFFNTHWNLGKPIDEIMALFAKHHVNNIIESNSSSFDCETLCELRDYIDLIK